MFRNCPGQKFTLFAFDSATGLPKSGDAANITASVSIDDAAPADLADTSAAEIDATKLKGCYRFDAAQAETNGRKLLVGGRSSTSGVVVVGAPAVIFTEPGVRAFTLASITDTSITLPSGHGIDPGANLAASFDNGTDAVFKSRFLKYNSGDTWDVSPSFVSDGETRPSGTLVAFIFPVPKVPTDSALLTKVDVSNWKGATAPAMTGDAFARVGAPAGASVSADIAAVKADTGALPSEIENADALLARNAKGGSNGPTAESVSAMLAGGAFKFSISGATLTVRYADGTTAFTRTLTRAEADAISAAA